MRYLRLLVLVALLVGTSMAHAQGRTFDAVLDQHVGADDPSVVLLVSYPDELLYLDVRGLADLEEGRAATVTDQYRIGSITKTFVAATVLLLQEQGLLSIDDPLSQWLPAEMVARIPHSQTMTLYHLLTMTSGIAEYADNPLYAVEVYRHPDHPWTAAETVAYSYDESPYFEPAQGWHYSNTNYTLLQLVIEAATGRPLAEVLASTIFEPVGMTETYLEDSAHLGAGIVRGYDMGIGGALEDVTEVNDALGLGDGGIVSTARDLELFARALFNGTLLTAESLATMREMVDTGLEGISYGLGLVRLDTYYGAVVGHDGAAGGFQSILFYHEDSGAVIVALTNNFQSEVLYDLLIEVLLYVAD